MLRPMQKRLDALQALAEGPGELVGKLQKKLQVALGSLWQAFWGAGPYVRCLYRVPIGFARDSHGMCVGFVWCSYGICKGSVFGPLQDL